MWQYCKWCKSYYNKLGCTCPDCFIPFGDASSLPDTAMQARLNQLWKDRFAFRGSELYIPMIEEKYISQPS